MHSAARIHRAARSLPREWRRLQARFLEGIGEPTEGFHLSPFQEEALQAVLEGDVLVVAPTGSGKTWIAEQVIGHFLDQSLECWYTSPLKALSNQKYARFQGLFGAERVGLLTGERRENSSAPLIVATTEVLRNALYEGDRCPALIILDEAHYLGDSERGTTWEEVIILAAPQSRLLMLSATVSNARELADWVEEVRGQPLHVVSARGRPVPLRLGFIDRRRRVLPLDPHITSFMKPLDLRSRFDAVHTIEALEEHNLLPVIVFLSRRRDCDRAASRFSTYPWPGREQRLQVFAQAVEATPHLWHHPLLSALVDGGVAPHHAGHLTGWKVAVEEMLSRGLLRAVFATTTLAAGLDVPARSVCLSSLMTQDEQGPRPLSALEFHQMTGRAGRRGKDRVGFAIVVPRHPKDLQLALALEDAEPEPLRSAFSLSYYQVLNLLHRFGLEGTHSVLDASFYLYQRGGRRARRGMMEGLRRRIQLLQQLGYLRDDLALTEVGQWGLLLRHQRSLVIMETVRRGLYRPLSPPLLAGWIGATVGSRAPYHLAGPINLSALKELVVELERLEARLGIAPMGLAQEFRPDSPAAFRTGRPGDAWRRGAVLTLWATGVTWEQTVRRADMEEGDLQRLVLQTAEVLREMEDLPLPDLAPLATEARLAIMREPVL